MQTNKNNENGLEQDIPDASPTYLSLTVTSTLGFSYVNTRTNFKHTGLYFGLSNGN